MNKNRLKTVQSFQFATYFLTLQLKVEKDNSLAANSSSFLRKVAMLVSKELFQDARNDFNFVIEALTFVDFNEEFLDISQVRAFIKILMGRVQTILLAVSHHEFSRRDQITHFCESIRIVSS